MSNVYYGIEPYTGKIICHAGIKGMKWGYTNRGSTLVDSGKQAANNAKSDDDINYYFDTKKKHLDSNRQQKRYYLGNEFDSKKAREDALDYAEEKFRQRRRG